MKNIINYKDNEFEIYLKNDLIKEKVRLTSLLINKEYANNKVIFLAVLHGSIPFLNEILNNINIEYEVNFIEVSSYKGLKKGKIVLKNTIEEEKIFNNNIVIVEDIIDSGSTIKYISDYLKRFNPKSLKVLSLLVKEETKVLCDYFIFKIPNKFVIGYGMDIDNLFRDLKDIYILKD